MSYEQNPPSTKEKPIRRGPLNRIGLLLSRRHRETTENTPLEKLTRHLNLGIKLIQQEKYTDAVSHFTDPVIAGSIGLSIPLEETYSYLLRETPSTPEAIEHITMEVARHTKYNHGPRELKLAQVIPIPSTKDDSIPAVSDALQHELSLIYAEEWVHAQQHLEDKPFATPTDGFAREKEVVQLFEQRGIVTDLVKKRHSQYDTLESQIRPRPSI